MRRRPRRGSALILVLMMTLAVAGLSIAAIFLSSSAGLLSQFYDRERDYRLAAEAALAQLRSRLSRDSTLVFPDTGVVQLLSGFQPTNAGGTPLSRVRVNVYAALTGDTSGLETPYLSLVAAAYDANGTRHVRRMDLRRESFARYSFLADSFSGSLTFGPGTVPGRVHSNESWRTGAGAAAATYLDTVTAVASLTGTGTYVGDTITGVPRVTYPADSTYPFLATLAAAGDLSFTPVSATGLGWTSGSRLEFVTVDADADGVTDEDEGFVRVFDLASGMDTARVRLGLRADSSLAGESWRDWQNRDVQNQCGAFYYRGGRWHFFPIATHRADWAQSVIVGPGSPNYPRVNASELGNMNDYNRSSATNVLRQPTARCFPAGSPYLVTTERKTNESGVVTGGAADTIPFGVVTPSGGWPAGGPYGGNDTTFTAIARTCDISVTGSTGRCQAGTLTALGSWRAFGGTPLSGVPSTVRQSVELPYLWPYAPTRNADSRRVIHATAGPLYVSGRVRGSVTLYVAGAVQVIDQLAYVTDPSDPSAEPCSDRLGLLAVGDILVADNGLTRGRAIGNENFQSEKRYGAASDLALHGSLMSLRGTVGVEDYGEIAVDPESCPADVSSNTSGGCLRMVGSMVMRRFSPLHSGEDTGLRYTGMKDPCQSTDNRPPFFPLTNRYTFVRTLEIEPSRANTPAKIRSILLRLKGKAL